MLLRAFLWILVAYFIYKFVFDFLLPIFTVSRRMKQQVKEFHRAQQQSAGGQQASAAEKDNTTPPKEKAGEYIDFEEVKYNAGKQSL